MSNIISLQAKPIYLHFLDRELRRAEKAEYSDDMVFDAVLIAVFSSFYFSYSSASLLIENNYLFPRSSKLILDLEGVDVIKLLTNEHSFDEFIDSRRKIYEHKADRYPMYFTEDSSRLWPKNPELVQTSTTNELRTSIFNWVGNNQNGGIISKDNFGAGIIDNFSHKLMSQKEMGITLDFFLDNKDIENDRLRRDTGRLISYNYTKRYLDLFQGDILCGLPQLSFFDELSSNRMLNNYSLIKGILNSLNIPAIFFNRNGEFLNQHFLSFVKHEMFYNVQIELFSIISGLVEFGKIQRHDLLKVINFFRNRFPNNRIIHTPNVQDHIFETHFRLIDYANKLSNEYSGFKINYEMTRGQLTDNKRVLIVVATPTEAQKFIQTMEKKGLNPTITDYNNNVSLLRFGVVNNSDIFMLKTAMGSSGAHGSTLAIKDAVESLNPDYIIMIGICYGLDPEKQKLGQILVARQLENYDHSKVTETTVIPRGDRIPCGAVLFNAFDTAALLYSKTKVQFGLMVSGDKLANSKSFTDYIRENHPEAIGADMEGVGLQSVSARERKEWILIKGICDWGFDKDHPDKESRQEVAIANVCDYLLFTLENKKL